MQDCQRVGHPQGKLLWRKSAKNRKQKNSKFSSNRNTFNIPFFKNLCEVDSLRKEQLAPARYFHISYVQYIAVMSLKFIISLSQ